MNPTPSKRAARDPLAERLPRLPEIPDEEIARRVVAGEVELFELLLRRYNQRLFRVARGIVSTDAEAEDVLQDAWVRAFEHLASFRGEALLSTWLSRIATHEAFARLRRGRRFSALSAEAEDRIEEVASAGPEARAFTGELRDALESAIAALPFPYRSVFLLREIEGLSTQETATSLELSVENVKVRLHRGKALLRRQLEARFDLTARKLFGFDGERCDRTVAAVLARIAVTQSAPR
ncbi:MAG: RNA polymerase sigma factor [Thermoanaerobaculia bacterium]